MEREREAESMRALLKGMEKAERERGRLAERVDELRDLEKALARIVRSIEARRGDLALADAEALREELTRKREAAEVAWHEARGGLLAE